MVTAALLFSIAILTRTPTEGPFQDLTFVQALAAAKRDNKVVMIDFFTTWCVPCKKLDSTTWKDADVVAWLSQKAIALKLDAEKEVDLAKQHNINAYPTMLLLKPDGSEIGRIVGYKTPKEFLSQATDTLAGKNAITRAKEKVVGHEKDPMARGNYADELAGAGRYEEALAEYLWCFDEGERASPAYAGVRVSFLVSDIVNLGQRYPPAIKALEDRRDTAESRLLGAGGSDDDVRVVVALNRDLGFPQRNLVLHDTLKRMKPLSVRMRYTFSHELLVPLVEARRYQDALDLFDNPPGYVTWSIKLHRSTPKIDDHEDEQLNAMLASMEIERINDLVSKCGKVYEALLGIGKPEMAATVATELIQFAPSGATYSTLTDLAVRAGSFDAARSMAEKGLKELPEAEQGAVRQAQARIPMPK